jgi:BirA family transcriptional regulator, biotin operon repressor / biotin---[acetyl-CoA-carboxylase] ligase
MMGNAPVAMRDGWTILRYESVDSTQIVAASLIADGAPHRTVVVAERQTAGYGRKGDVWCDLPGACLLMTVIVRPHGPTAVPQYAMIASLACIEAIEASAGLAATLKWPNDVLLNGRKVAGILGDATWQGARLAALRLGIGINIAGDRAAFLARELPDATSLAAEAGHAIDRNRALAAWLAAFARLEDRCAADHGAEIVAAWRASLATLGRPVIAARADGSAITGVATGVTDDGDVIVTTERGDTHCLHATDIRSLRHVE